MNQDAAGAAQDKFSSNHDFTLDLTDGSGALVENFAESNPEGVRLLLAALDFSSSEPVTPPSFAAIFDLAMYRATGSVRLAEQFCREFGPCR